MSTLEERLKKFGAAPISQEMSERLSRFGAVPVSAPAMELAPEGVDTSTLEALARGAAQGATFGFADEITGAGETALDVLRGKTALADWTNKYIQNRDESRAEYKANEDQHGVASFVGNLAGGILPGLATGGTATLGSAIRTGIGSGIATGIGMSEADDLSGNLQDGAISGALGGVLGGAVKLGVDKFGDSILSAGGKVASATGTIAKAPLDSDLIGGLFKSLGQGTRGRALVGTKAGQGLQQEVIDFEKKEIREGIQDALTSARSQKEELLENGEMIPVKGWYDSFRASLDSMDEAYGKNPEVSSEIAKTKEMLDNYVLGRMKTLKVDTIMEVPEPSPDQLRKILDRVDDLNAGNEVKQKLASDGIRDKRRTYTAVGDSPEEILNNQFGEGRVSLLAKDGKLSKAVLNTDADSAPVLSDAADAMETAQRYLDEQFILSGAPYKTQIFPTESKGPVLSIVNTATNKPIGKPYSLDDLTKPGVVKKISGTQEVSVRVPDAVGPDMRMTPEMVEQMKVAFGELGSVGEKPLKTTAARAAVNRGLSNTDRNMNLVEKKLNLPDSFTPLKELIEENVEGIKPLNEEISAFLKAQEKIPSLNALQSVSSDGKSSTSAVAKWQDFLGELPENFRTKVAARGNDLAEARDLRDKITAAGLSEKGVASLVAGTVRGVAYGTANIVGLGARGLYKAAPESIQATARKLASSSDGATREVARVLERAAGRDQLGRNALIFALQQNPAYRAVLDAEYGIEPEKKK